MQIEYALIASAISLGLIAVVYHHVGWAAILSCYRMWFTRSYWTNYNVVEALSWITKAVIIIPGLILGVQLWWLAILTLATSLTLIWASNRKLLPTLVAFNTMWVWLSCMILMQHFVAGAIT
jgi:hypothetical protein